MAFFFVAKESARYHTALVKPADSRRGRRADLPGHDHPLPGYPVLGISVASITVITHVDAPYYFVDEQRMGPYRFWHHQHHLRPLNDGVEMIDTVHYCLKFGPIGRLLQ